MFAHIDIKFQVHQIRQLTSILTIYTIIQWYLQWYLFIEFNIFGSKGDQPLLSGRIDLRKTKI
jgi:hypothetical protein